MMWTVVVGLKTGFHSFVVWQALLLILWPCIMRPVSSLSQNNQQFKSLITLCMTKTKSYKYRTTVKDDIKNYCWMCGFYSFYRLMHWGGESIVKSSFRLILVIVFLYLMKNVCILHDYTQSPTSSQTFKHCSSDSDNCCWSRFNQQHKSTTVTIKDEINFHFISYSNVLRIVSMIILCAV